MAYLTEPSFDPHKGIDGPKHDWTDPELSKLDRMENRQWARDADDRHKSYPVPASAAVVHATGHPYHQRRSRHYGAWIAGVLAVVVAVLLVVAVWS